MKIAVISSNGKAGKLIVKEALNQGLDVTGIARGENKSDADSFIQKDIFDLTTDDIEGFDVLVDAFGTFTPDTLSQHETTLAHLSDLVSGTSTRLIVVGGAGSLYLDKDHTQQLKDSPDFPDLFKPLASVMSQALDELRTRDDVNWTYISPAADFQFDGKKTGNYCLSGEDFSVNANGESVISYVDYATALVKVILSGHHIKERISVLQK